jgi:hypothetical protein
MGIRIAAVLLIANCHAPHTSLLTMPVLIPFSFGPVRLVGQVLNTTMMLPMPSLKVEAMAADVFQGGGNGGGRLSR